MEFGIAIVGCGTVGSAVAALVIKNAERLRNRTGHTLAVKAIVSRSFNKARAAGLPENLFRKSLDEALADKTICLVVETIGGIDTAGTVIKTALNAGKHVVTANKAILAHKGTELFALARKNGVSIGFESSCAGGIPIIRALVDGLLANKNDAIYGIVNGTSNFILTEMVEHGRTYNEALLQAQNDGLAETDPILDVDGTDAAHKLAILSSLAFGSRVPLEAIPVEGIDKIDLFDVETGKELGYVLKLIAFARKSLEGLETAVKPVFLPKDHPLALVAGPFNAISVYGDSVGHTMYYGRGAGGMPTASAIVADILAIALGSWPLLFQSLDIWPDRCPQARLADADNTVHRHYLRFDVEDQSGILAEITAELAKHRISLKSFIQKEYHQGNLVPVVLTTHEARVAEVMEAFEKIKSLPTVGENAVHIRIIDEHAEKL